MASKYYRPCGINLSPPRPTWIKFKIFKFNLCYLWHLSREYSDTWENSFLCEYLISEIWFVLDSVANSLLSFKSDQVSLWRSCTSEIVYLVNLLILFIIVYSTLFKHLADQYFYNWCRIQLFGWKWVRLRDLQFLVFEASVQMKNKKSASKSQSHWFVVRMELARYVVCTCKVKL